MSKLVVIAHDIRSIHNIGSLLRTADGLGVEQVYLTGYSPYPKQKNDTRLPHECLRITRQINKTALGAEKTYGQHHQDLHKLLADLKQDNYIIAGLEQARNSISLAEASKNKKIALILGSEVEGLDPLLQEQCDITIEIPMKGQKESFNVTIAAAIAMYHLTYLN